MIDWLIKKYPDNNWRAIGSYFRKLGKTQFPVLLLTAPYLGAIHVNYFDLPWYVLVMAAGLSRPGKSQEGPGTGRDRTGLRDPEGPGTKKSRD